ncbi:MAG: hypothetical protein ACRD6W_10460 [Nitrososphaerales archaeon]
MFKRIIATAALGGSLAIGGSTAAWAASSTTQPTQFNCTNAPKALARITKLESKAQTFVTKATAREATATKAGHTRVAKFIQHRITAVQRREAKGTALMKRIESACPGSGPATSSSS